MSSISRIYIGDKLVSKVYVRGEIATIGTGLGATSSGPLFENLPEIANPVDSMVRPVVNSTFPSTSSSNIALLGSLGLSSIDMSGFSIPCDDGLPTKADITNLFNKLSQIPSKIKLAIVQAGEEMAEDVREQLRATIKDIEELIEKIADLLSPYWEKGTVRNWQKEAKDAWDELIQEYHIFIPVKMLEMIAKLIPVDFNVNILGIDINVLKIFTAEEQTRIKAQIIEKIPTLPAPYDKLFNGEFGVICDEWRAKYTWQYIKNEIIQWCTNALWKAFGALIKKFKKIWKALKLPSLPDLLEFDVESFIQGHIDSLRAKAEALKDKIENFSVTGYIVKELEKVEIFGKKLIDIIGGKIDETVLCGEELIADLMRQAKEWFAQWQKELLNQWIKKVKKFLDKIGLGKLLALLSLTFCDVLALLGVPTSIDLKIQV